MRLFSECVTDSALESIEVFGSGVGIWNGRRQFRLEQSQIEQIAGRILEAKFATMPDSFGGSSPPLPDAGKPDDSYQEALDAALKVICRVQVDLDGRSKQVVQFERGEQSAELRALAQGLREICEGPAASGRTIADLNDGLERIASGELAPETLSVRVHRKPRRGQDGPGFLLHLDGSRVRSTDYSESGELQDEVRHALDGDQLSEFARQLVPLDLASFPQNLYSEVYTDVRIGVLDREIVFQARRFAGMTAETRALEQQRLSRLWSEILQLRDLVRAPTDPGEDH